MARPLLAIGGIRILDLPGRSFRVSRLAHQGARLVQLRAVRRTVRPIRACCADILSCPLGLCVTQRHIRQDVADAHPARRWRSPAPSGARNPGCCSLCASQDRIGCYSGAGHAARRSCSRLSKGRPRATLRRHLALCPATKVCGIW
jgi:hypothetical protein